MLFHNKSDVTVYDKQRRIIGHVAAQRVKLMKTLIKADYKVGINEYLPKIVQVHQIRKEHEAYSFCTPHPRLIDRIGNLNGISDVVGYTPLNVPRSLIGKYKLVARHPIDGLCGFACGSDEIYKTNTLLWTDVNNKAFSNSQLNGAYDSIVGTRDPLRHICLVPLQDRHSFKQLVDRYVMNNGGHILTVIPKGSMMLRASDHWYRDSRREMNSCFDICVVMFGNEEGIDQWPLTKGYVKDFEDALNSEVVGNRKIRIDVNKLALTKKNNMLYCRSIVKLPCVINDYVGLVDSSDPSSSKISNADNGGVPKVVVYTDASIVKNKMAVGIWCNHGELKLEKSFRLTGLLDINRGELAAILLGLMMIPNTYDVIVKTDSITSIQLIKKKIWCEKYNDLVDAIRILLENWQGSVQIVKVKGHSGDVGNDNADYLARYGVDNDVEVANLPDS